jgi:fatty acid desaturase
MGETLQTDIDANLAKRAQALTADLTTPDPRRYWLDFAVTSGVVYASLWLALANGPLAARVLAATVCVFCLYRAVSFIHELTHLGPGDAPGFRFAWNLLIGVPFLVPSLLYEGVHNLHHTTRFYGTAKDPEYLPLARFSGPKFAGFILVALLAPVGQMLRFAVAAPLSFVAPGLRRFVVSRLSAMAINPGFRREDLANARSAAWLAQEIGCWLWSWCLLALIFAGGVAAQRVLTAAAILAAATFVNQLRTVSAHAWVSEGRPLSFAEQFEDSVNIPPPARLPALWAPVGLRYHALHHLLPRLPYHNLAAAHRRLVEQLPAHSGYRDVDRSGLFAALFALRRGRPS